MRRPAARSFLARPLIEVEALKPIALAILVIIGCKREQITSVSVRGSVRVDDVLLNEGVIKFIPQGSTPGPQVSGPIRGGLYEIGPAAGLRPGLLFAGGSP